jgi:membrane protein DedA with SNARE-associated domain
VSEYLAQYGYLAVLLGALIEGETILLLAGFAIQQGSLDLTLVLSLGFLGAFAGDQFWFYMARRHGSVWLARRPHLLAKAARAKHLLDRHATLFILSFRFIYGMRNLGAMVIALSAITTRRFIFLNLIAAAVWAFVVIMSGYFFGEAAVALLDGLASIEQTLFAVFVVLALAVIASLLLRRWLLRRLS